MEGGLPTTAAFLRVIIHPIPSDLSFVIAGNEFLYPYNLYNFYSLREKREIPGLEGLRGTELDHALVVLEQTLVQQFMDSYAWPTPEDKRAACRRLSAGFDSWVMNPWIRKIVTDLFRKETPFDLGAALFGDTELAN